MYNLRVIVNLYLQLCFSMVDVGGLGDKDIHSCLISETACGVQAAVIFVDYGRSLETQYPVPINQAYAATKWATENSKPINVDSSRLAVASDSGGGNMAIAVTMLAKKSQKLKVNLPFKTLEPLYLSMGI